MSRDVKFPFEFIGYDMIHDATGAPFYAVQCKVGGSGNPKCTIVYREGAPGMLTEVLRVPEIYGVPIFYIRPDGQAIVSGPMHESPIKRVHHSDPIPGFTPLVTTARLAALVTALEQRVSALEGAG